MPDSPCLFIYARLGKVPVQFPALAVVARCEGKRFREICVSSLDSNGRTIWIADAHGYGKRFVVRADEKLTAFVELQRAIHGFAVSLIS